MQLGVFSTILFAAFATIVVLWFVVTRMNHIQDKFPRKDQRVVLLRMADAELARQRKEYQAGVKERFEAGLSEGNHRAFDGWSMLSSDTIKAIDKDLKEFKNTYYWSGR